MADPVIGITTYRSYNRAGSPLIALNEAYIRAVLMAGGTPVMIPLGVSENRLLGLFKWLDGILFSGGGDVHPSFYGSEPHPLADEVDRDRDRIELNLVNHAVETGKPFLGICRGLQVINVALGGSLYEDIETQTESTIQHQTAKDYPRNHLAHPVDISAGSTLHQILQQLSIQVNSFHHQAIRDLASGLTATALARDSIIEAIELKDHPFGLGVQWHPEGMVENSEMLSLFQAFIQAADSAA